VLTSACCCWNRIGNAEREKEQNGKHRHDTTLFKMEIKSVPAVMCILVQHSFIEHHFTIPALCSKVLISILRQFIKTCDDCVLRQYFQLIFQLCVSFRCYIFMCLKKRNVKVHTYMYDLT